MTAEEYNIEVDENDNVIGSRPKSYFQEGNGIHRSVFLLLFNSQGQILLQKRAITKKWYPGLWTASVAGTVSVEDCDESIIRETKEEIGLTLKPKFIFKSAFFTDTRKAFFYVYSASSNDSVKPEAREIDEIKWIDIGDLREDILINPNKYTPPFAHAMKIYFEKYHEK